MTNHSGNTWLFLAAALLAGCGAEEPAGRGDVAITTWGEGYIEQEIPVDPGDGSGFIDGWTVSYEKFLVNFQNIKVADAAGKVAATMDGSLLVDNKVEGVKSLIDFPDVAAKSWDRVSYEIAPVSAGTELGDSAIHKLIQVLDRLLKAQLPVDEFAGDTTVNVGQIQGGYAPNVIADKAEAQVLIRTVCSSEPVRAKVREAVAGLAEVDFTLDLAFVRLCAIEGLPTMVAKFATDIPELSNWGQPLLLGPGSIHVAHTPDEKLSKKELLEAVDLYIKVARSLLV